MQIHTSFEKSENGQLFIVPTPIGNLDDMTFRAVNTLKDVDMILAEDTRHTQKLMNHFSIKNKLLSFHQHNTFQRMEGVLGLLLKGEKLALVSDAGMPGISDPGYELIKAVIAEDISVVVLPGANAAICAVVGSGISTDEFLFHGFLPKKKQDKIRELERLGALHTTFILYESPYRVKQTLMAIEKTMGNRNIVISREITKIYEQYIRGTCTELIEWADTSTMKGEFCIVVEGGIKEEGDESWWTELTIEAHVHHYEQLEFGHKEAMKKVATDRQISKRNVYQVLHVDNK